MLKMCGIVCFRDKSGNFTDKKQKIYKECETGPDGFTETEISSIKLAASFGGLADAFRRYTEELNRLRAANR